MQQSSDETTAAPTTSEDKIHAPCDLDVAWHEHLLPPYPLPSSFIPLNTTTTTQQQTSYQSGIHNQQHQNLLSDAMRQLLEECDTVQGFQILTSPGGYAGLTASLLEEVRDECKSAARLTMIVEDNGNTQTSSSSHDARLAFRRRLDTGLVYHGIGTSSDVMLPLSLSSMAAGLDDQSTFEASAVAALALECSTLSYRLLDNAQRSQIALAGTGMVGCDAMFTTTPRISYRDYVASIKPSNRHTILELEARTTPLVGRSLSSWLLDGISSNGDARQRQHPWPSRTPGEWLTSPFFLQPLSFTPTPSQSALPHTFFALSSSIRPSRWDTTPNAVLDYTLPVMEGLATCRPERFSSTVVNSSIASTTRDGYAYWGTLLCRNSDRNNLRRDGLQRAPNTSIFNALNDTPIVSILGNTTKSHAHLHTKQLNFKQCLDRKSKGYWAMEQSQNSDLEYDDCIEVADYWMELDNAYYVDDGQGDTDEYYE